MVSMSASDILLGVGTLTNQAVLNGVGTAVMTMPLNLPVKTPGTTNANAIVSFTTTTQLTVGQMVYINFPTGFFVASASTPQCSYASMNSPTYAFTVSGSLKSATCSAWSLDVTTSQNVPAVTPSTTGFSYYTLTTTGTVPAGTYTITLMGTTLSATTLSSNPTGLIVTTDADVCYSAGAATGAIAPPGGANGGASSGQALLLSSLAVLSSLLLLL